MLINNDRAYIYFSNEVMIAAVTDSVVSYLTILERRNFVLADKISPHLNKISCRRNDILPKRNFASTKQNLILMTHIFVLQVISRTLEQ